MTDADQALLVRTETSGGVRTVTLDSPHNANALSSGLLTQLHAALEDAFGDARVRVVVLTGAGRVFCAGADLKEALTSPAGATGATGPPGAPGLMAAFVQLLWSSSKPVICRVNGAARAGGIGIVAACDVAIATRRATFAFSEVRIGVVPAVISVPCLRRMPSRAAAEYFLTGEVFDAPRATEIGLLTRAVAEDDLDAEVARYAGMLLRGAPGALAGTKGLLREVPGLDVTAGLARMAEVSGRFFGSDEAREGMTAFAAKRDPAWVESVSESVRGGQDG
jgi:methylglutaconyl-CoA hydratase